jgi:hypothetical protein
MGYPNRTPAFSLDLELLAYISIYKVRALGFRLFYLHVLGAAVGVDEVSIMGGLLASCGLQIWLELLGSRQPA